MACLLYDIFQLKSVSRKEPRGVKACREYKKAQTGRGRQEGMDIERNLPLTEALFYILLSVRGPNHGYGIIQEVEKLTEGRVVLGAGTLYGAIQAMTAKGWIRIYSAETDSRKKKEYIITDLGRKVFAEEIKRLAELLHNGQLMWRQMEP